MSQILMDDIKAIEFHHNPNIIKYYANFMDENQFFIMVEYADRKSLENYLSSKKSLLFEDKILRIGSQIAAGLDFIHQKSFFVEI